MNRDRAKAFLQFILGPKDGHLLISTKAPAGQWDQYFFEWPTEIAEAISTIDRYHVRRNVYFCPTLFSGPYATKPFAQNTSVVWADLDERKPDSLLVAPSIVLETSPSRFQAFWKLQDEVSPIEAEALSRRISRFHDIDPGWNVNKLLRIPHTYNLKREEPVEVQIAMFNPSNIYTPDSFSVYPVSDAEDTPSELPPLPQGGSAKAVLDRYKLELSGRVFELFEHRPLPKQRSQRLWELELSLLEAGLSPEDTFRVCTEAACNKFAQEGRPPVELWKDVHRAWAEVKRKRAPIVVDEYRPDNTLLVPLLTEEDRKFAESRVTFVERYIEWAKSTGDAAWQYHQAGAFTILSAILAQHVRLPTSAAMILPNLWFMVLGDTTLTRKSTAMELALDLLLEVDQESILATDGSIEGILTAMQGRAGRTSLFHRDEVTGLVEQMAKRDYMAGMAETMAKLYDGRFQRRLLRSEEIVIHDPIFIMLVGGAKSRMFELLNQSHVLSGFLPRFVFLIADPDLTKIKPLGPPTKEGIKERVALVRSIKDMHEWYSQRKKNGLTTAKIKKAVLTNDAWARYGKYEHALVSLTSDTVPDSLTNPMMDRLSKSGLKAAVLIAASRLDTEVVVTEEDIVHAFYYVEQWRTYTVELLHNLGMTPSERKLERAYRFLLQSGGSDTPRSSLMRALHLDARETDALLTTMEQRGMIKTRTKGRRNEIQVVA